MQCVIPTGYVGQKRKELQETALGSGSVPSVWNALLSLGFAFCFVFSHNFTFAS